MGLDAVDALVATLAEIAGSPVPERLERQRAQLQDAMLDCHFMLGMSRFAIAADADLLVGLQPDCWPGSGPRPWPPWPRPMPPPCAWWPLRPGQDRRPGGPGGPGAARRGGWGRGPDRQLARRPHRRGRLGIPLLRAGFPQYDLVGGYQRTWIGYQGTRATLFDLANILSAPGEGEIHPYRSRLSPRLAEAAGPPGMGSDTDGHVASGSRPTEEPSVPLTSGAGGVCRGGLSVPTSTPGHLPARGETSSVPGSRPARLSQETRSSVRPQRRRPNSQATSQERARTGGPAAHGANTPCRRRQTRGGCARHSQ